MSLSQRVYSKYTTKKTKEMLIYLTKKITVQEYKISMFWVGMELGKKIISNNPKEKYFYIVSTVEDADFLAKGVMECFKLNNKGFNIACFWNSRETTSDNERISPVIRRYIEPYSPPGKAKGQVVILKSLISGACVVKTNIKEIIEKINPKKIIVTAPIMHTDAHNKLEKEFTKEIVEKFSYLYFAKDPVRKKGVVIPGIGDVYKKLGFKNQADKNRYTPKIVQERRAAYLG